MPDEKIEPSEACDVVLSDGSAAPVGRSIFDPWPARPTPPWQPPDDTQHAHMQQAIGDTYAAWSAAVDENPPEQQGSSEWTAEGSEYPPFSYLFDADPEKRDALRDEVLNAVRPDAAGA